MTVFSPYMSLFGGALIGLSAVVLMLVQGRIAGMTGIVSGLVPPLAKDWDWRVVFLIGAVAAPIVLMSVGFVPAFEVPVSTPLLLFGGVLVGIGASFGGGCPSGHGVCGLARFSPRSLVAVVTFMATCALTVFVVRHVMGV